MSCNHFRTKISKQYIFENDETANSLSNVFLKTVKLQCHLIFSEPIFLCNYCYISLDIRDKFSSYEDYANLEYDTLNIPIAHIWIFTFKKEMFYQTH